MTSETIVVAIVELEKFLQLRIGACLKEFCVENDYKLLDKFSANGLKITACGAMSIHSWQFVAPVIVLEIVKLMTKSLYAS